MQINKSTDSVLSGQKTRDSRFNSHSYTESENISIAADPVVQYMNKDQLKKTLQATKKQMEAAAKELDFMEAARLRDEMYAIEKLIQDKDTKILTETIKYRQYFWT
jgi:excinuclease ABC subunit B